jgi:uncharacterized membrane protein
MQCDKYYKTHDFRWVNSKGEKMNWKETLRAMCDYYGQFCGRWHSNDFWAKTKKELENMTEEQAELTVREIEKAADMELEVWKMYN